MGSEGQARVASVDDIPPLGRTVLLEAAERERVDGQAPYGLYGPQAQWVYSAKARSTRSPCRTARHTGR